MIDFIVKLENMLRLSGYNNWEIRYLPKEKTYRLKLDNDIISMREVTGKEKKHESCGVQKGTFVRRY